jgi:hypothetical protein
MRKIYWALCCLLWMASGCQKNNRSENITPLNTGQWRTFLFSHEGNDLSAAMALAIYQFKPDGSLILIQPGTADTGLYFIRQIDGKNIVTIQIKDNPVITLLNKDWELLELNPERVRMQNTVGNKTSLLTLVR